MERRISGDAEIHDHRRLNQQTIYRSKYDPTRQSNRGIHKKRMAQGVLLKFWMTVQSLPFEVINALRYNPVNGTHDLLKIYENTYWLRATLFLCLEGLFVDSLKTAAECGTTVNASS